MKRQYDDYGRLVRDENGQKFNYSFEESRSFIKHNDNPLQAQADSGDHMIPETGGLIACEPVWQYAVMGYSIGTRSMDTYDFNNDGIPEIICSAKSGNTGGYWYILKYNAENQQYEHSYVSEWNPNYIRRITLSDLNSDGIREILIGYENGILLIFNSSDHSLLGQLTIPSGDYITDIQTGDADNDGLMELAISDDEQIYFYNPATFSLKSQIPYGSYYFRIGNMDEDIQNEIVTSKGKVIEYNGSVASLQWEVFNGVFSAQVEISDLDGDNMKELITTEGWSAIKVYDVNTQSLKFTISTSQDIFPLLVKDVNNDNIDEIIYGDGQWGSVHCVDATTHIQLWQVANPEHGVTGIAVDDVDNDGSQEVIWGAGWTSTGPDYLFVAGVESQSIEWQSVDIVGPFYGVEISDVDNDSTLEIVAVSYGSESGYGSGILSVFDAETYELEWQCDGNFFDLVWTGIYGLEIADTDNDGVKEIIIAAGRTYTGKIWIVNGISKEIESSYAFYAEEIDEFYALTVADIDEDGQPEIIVGDDMKVYVINPDDFTIAWSSEGLQGYTQPAAIRAGNVDDDPAREIVVCKGRILVFDVNNQQQWESGDNNYSILDLFDVNHDGRMEIVAGTTSGTVVIIDGTTHEIIRSFQPVNSRIDGIQIADLNGDEEPEFVFSSGGRIYFYSNTDLMQYTRKYVNITGMYDGLKLYDKNNDGVPEVYAGTSSQVMELSSACYECLWFNVIPHITPVSCGGAGNGSISLTISGGEFPYTYLWSTGSTDSSLSNLSTGSYWVKVWDHKGCEFTDTLIVVQALLITDFQATEVSCGETSDGSAAVTIVEGYPPYHYLWNTGDTTAAISNLSAGVYTVEIRDAMNCYSSESIYIQKDTLLAYTNKADITCFGMTNGIIFVEVTEGTFPYTYTWSHGATGYSLYNLPAGDYSVTVSDADGCNTGLVTTIIEPPAIVTQITTTPDNPNTIFWEGTATIEVSGGVPPYEVYWNDPYQQTGFNAINLLLGTYTATVVDSHNCFASDIAVIDSTLSVQELQPSPNMVVYPNPSGGSLNIELTEMGTFDVTVDLFDYTGRLRYSKVYSDTDRLINLNLSAFENGLFRVAVKLKNKEYNYLVEIIR